MEILYAIDKTKGADFLKALNLADGAQRYTNADALDEAKYFYQSDVLIDALAAALILIKICELDGFEDVDLPWLLKYSNSDSGAQPNLF